MASVRRRERRSGGVIWQVRWRLPDGSSRSASFATKRAAVAFKSERDRDESSGGSRLDPRAGAVALSVVWDRWWRSAGHLRPKTRESYAGHWRLRIEPVLGGWPVSRITRGAVEDWAAGLTIGASGARTAILLLRALLDRAVADGAVGANVARLLPLPSLPVRERHRFLTAGQVDRLAGLCEPQGDVVTVLALTGLRWGELAGLRVRDVDVARRRLHVRQAITWASGLATVGPPKSRAGVRTIPLPALAWDALARRIGKRGPDELVVTAPRGGPLNPGNWRRSVGWGEAVAALGVEGLRPHDLRHTYASLARAAGADLRMVQTVMGHGSVTVTASIYADLFDGELDTVAVALDALTSARSDTLRGPTVAHIDQPTIFD